MTDLTLPIFTDAEKAREHLEALHWPDGPVCPHCGTVSEATLVKGKSHRPGLYQCNACREPFTVTVGTVMEGSHIPLNKWVLGFHLMASSKKGISAHQLHRMLGVTYKSAWFMAHRIREAMTPAKKELPPLGGEGKTVEVDETLVGGKEMNRHRSKRFKTHVGGNWGKETVFSLVERGGQVRSMHVSSVTAATLRPIMKAHIADRTTLMTDDAGQYRHMHKDFEHYAVNHGAEEYVRKVDGMLAHTNTAEGFFSILKRGIYGCYFHVSEQHLHRYLVEFDFRYNNRIRLGIDDTTRAEKAMAGARGKRLTYYEATA